MRHPQYVAFILIMFGFLLQWPTLLTLIMFPILVWAYVHLAKAEERDAIAGSARNTNSTENGHPHLSRNLALTTLPGFDPYG